MRRLSYILIASLLAFVACERLDEPDKVPEVASVGERVTISFNVEVPGDGAATKAMGIAPTIDPNGFYIAVFGGSGYFNEWVKATVVSATSNYPSNGTVYNLSANLSVSDSRLRVHFIANCPTALRSSPPISGSTDTEEYVLSRVRSQLSETYNDGYWQKIILPNGIKAVKNENDVWEATQETLGQFPDPIVMVRNFARVYLRNLTPVVGETGNGHQLVTIKKFGLAYAPAEGVIAPILSNPYTSNVTGAPIPPVGDNDNTTPVYLENFFINYQNYPITSDDPSVTVLTGEPFNYGGYSPSDQSYVYYTGEGHTDPGSPLLADLQTFDNEHPENNVLFVYERSIPTATRRATRVIIYAERIDQNGVSDGNRYYALDIVNSEGVSIPLLRNQTYTVHLLNIEAGSGETDITKAATATSATVTGDPNFQNLINISDGKSSIGTSFTEQFYVQPQEDYVMFRYIPTNITDENYVANKEGNELVTIKVGSLDTQTGIFTQLTPAQASAQGILAFATDDSGNYKVSISKDGNNVIQYVRSNNTWRPATSAEIANAEIEKWGMIKYELNSGYKDSENYFTEERTQAILVVGSYNDRDLTRSVIIKTSPRQDMYVTCQQKYVLEKAGEEEVVRVLIPTGLSRSVFPLEFTIEPDGYSLTPNGDILPVDYGTSTIPGKTGPAYFFVKTLTQDAYDALGTVQQGGRTWKYFDCSFKTTVSQNACTVYVKNRFFNADNSSDFFSNFSQRLFTFTATPSGSVYRHGNTTFTFVMDNDHSSAATVAWWDPENLLQQSANADEARDKGLSVNNRVLPPIMTVELTGFTPQYQSDGETPVTTNLRHSSGNTYLYYVGTGTPLHDMATVSLALTATGAIGSTASVKLSTANLTDNPQLYADLLSSTVSIQGAAFSGLSFSPAQLALGLNKTTTFSFTYADGLIVPITITLNGLAPNGSDSRLTDNGNGVYTFTPDNSNRNQTISLKSTTRFSAGTVTLSHDDYSNASLTINRSLMIPAGTLKARGYYIGQNGVEHADENPTKLQTNNNNGGTAVTLSASKDGTSAGTVYFNTSFLNRNDFEDTNNRFSNLSDNTVVYAKYTVNNKSYYGTVTLGAILTAIENNTYTPINLYRWADDEKYEIDFTSSDNYYTSNHTFTDSGSGVSAAFDNCPGARDWAVLGYVNYRKDIGTDNGNSGSITVTYGTKPGCLITGLSFTYFGNYNKRDVYVNNTSIGAGAASWTYSPSGEAKGGTSVEVRMATNKNGSHKVNAITKLTINYGYYDF